MTGAPVAINARAAQRLQHGGVERWAHELAERLPRLRPERYRVLAPPPTLAHRAGHAWEQLALPAAARRASLILSPANLAPLVSRRNVVVIHDVAPLRGPDWYGRTYRAWQRLVLPRIARGAQLVLVPSAFVASELIDLLGLDEASVEVVAPGVSTARTGDDWEHVRQRLGLERPYVLALGTDSVRKNFALLDAIAPSLDREGLEVVIAGATRGYLRRSPGTAARRLGYVSERDLPALYANAAAFAMPSLYEGFGLPCIEAMAAGTPVVASDRGALPETCARAATLVAPGDRDAFAAALVAAALDPAVRTRLVDAGRAHAAAFSWGATAARVDELVAAQLVR